MASPERFVRRDVKKKGASSVPEYVTDTGFGLCASVLVDARVYFVRRLGRKKYEGITLALCDLQKRKWS